MTERATLRNVGCTSGPVVPKEIFGGSQCPLMAASCLWRPASFDCGFNRSMQQFGGIVRRVFRSLVFFLGAHSISLPLR